MTFYYYNIEDRGEAMQLGWVYILALSSSPLDVYMYVTLTNNVTRVISDFFIQYPTGCVCTKESDSFNVHSVNGLGQNSKCHVRKFLPTEIRTASPEAAILHSSFVGC